MNEILSVGLILVFALFAGHAAQLVRIPEVTGYLLVGVVIGPAGFDLISHDNVKTLGFKFSTSDENPADATLATAAKWTKVFTDNKQLAGARIVSLA